MANLDVQPKKRSILPWILTALAALILLFLLSRGCNDNEVDNEQTTTVIDSGSTPDASQRR